MSIQCPFLFGSSSAHPARPQVGELPPPPLSLSDPAVISDPSRFGPTRHTQTGPRPTASPLLLEVFSPSLVIALLGGGLPLAGFGNPPLSCFSFLIEAVADSLHHW